MSASDEHDSGGSEEKGMSDLPGSAAFATMGLSVAVIIGIGVFLGIWADDAWGHAPLWLAIGLVLGTVAAVVSVVKQVRRFL